MCLIKRLKNIGKPLFNLSQPQLIALDIFREKCTKCHYHFEDAYCQCGKSTAEGMLVARQDRYGLSVDTWLCTDCALMWTSPRLSIYSLTRFYQEDYRLIYSDDKLADDRFFNDQMRRGEKIVSFLNIDDCHTKNQRSVLDIGCGSGGTLAPFSRLGWKAIGCDLGDDYLAYGRQQGLQLIHGTAASLQLQKPVDLLIASHILEHIPDPLAELRVWSSLLRDKGLLYIELPGILRAYENYGDIGLFLQNAHLYHFTLSTLSYVVSRAGFRLLKGDEGICAVFIKEPDAAQTPMPVDEVKIIHDYIRKKEAWLPWKKLRQWLLTKRSQIVRSMLGHRLTENLKSLLQRSKCKI